MCEILLENGAEVDHAAKKGKTTLFAAAGAELDMTDCDGKTAFHLSGSEGHDNVDGIDGEGRTVVRVLLDRGLDEQHRDNAGWGHLHYAAFEGHSIIVKLLGDFCRV